MNWAEKSNIKPNYNLTFENQDLKKLALGALSDKIGAQVTDVDDSLKLNLKKKPDDIELKKMNDLGFELTNVTKDGLELGILDIQFISVTDSEIKNLSPLLPTSLQWTIDEKIKILSQVINSDYSQNNSLGKKSSLINLALFENEKTDYHSGGEFAIQQQSLYRNEIQWKTFGLFVEALPTSLNDDEIHLDVKVKMSYLTATDINQPSLNQDRWHQKLRLEKNKTLIVSNTLTNMFSKNRKNHLFFKSIPILNSLFYGKTQSDEKSNVYMLIRLNSGVH
jgi:Flp pilus assembly secretin CpaC